MNRAERRRQAKAARRSRFIVTGILLSPNDVLDLLDRSPAITARLGCMIAGMASARPPLCGACEASLTIVAPPAGYVLWRHSGSAEEIICGICDDCLDGDRAALGRRLTAYLGVEPMPAAHVHTGQWGRA